MKVLALIPLLVAVHPQEFKPAAPIEKERYVYGLPVTAKKGSRFSKLNLVPGGWELWVVEVNGARPFQFGDMDQPNPTILEKARACTRVHQALSAEKSSVELTIVVRRPGNSRGILVKVAFSDWDTSLEYAWRKWRQDPKLFILPQASTQAGSEPYVARVEYTEAERLAEVAEYELRKKEEAEERKSPGAPLKSRETFRIAQRKLRLDAGIEKPVAADDGYLASRREKAGELQRRASERMEKRDLFEAHRLARHSMALDKGGTAATTVDSVKAALGPLDPEERGRLRAKVLQQSVAEVREKNFAEAAEGAAFCLFMADTDKEAAKILSQTRKAAFGEKEMTKSDLDRWVGILGPLAELPSSSELKEDVIYRVSGKVARAGPFTLVESPKTASKFVFEDKAGLKFDVDDTFTLVAVFDGAKPPTSMPEDLRSHPFLRLVVIR